ncbi:MAG: hypothetical protein RM368_18165 [Nostoc sp. DedSLP03]|uniref:hypothetical protein n=1 Tax=Nostoc sp. DedSLP03 TaxID=3075400 RepID=UPI002AD54808|nr:hypothetical protein [Nostoc sp. DedSLP03]MDZ7966875.1 hypothetical protein [Nostoc sp. DedSLP03]
MENPRQFASLDASDAALHGSLTNRPASGVPAGDPIDFEAISARVRYERTLPNYEYKESPAELALRLERQAAAEQRIKAETAATNERNRLLLEREQIQRNGLRNRISGSEVVDAEFVQPTRRESPLSQIQRSTPERQPLPSTGAPPPTLNGTAARADSLVEPTATPRPAIIREAIGNTVGGIGQALPKTLPQAAGRLVAPGVTAGLTFAGALIAGQSVTQAATTTVGVVAGSVVGGIIGTAIGGPLGGYIGSSIGGFAGGYLANALFPPQLPSGVGHLESNAPNYPPFVGGQGVGALYSVRCTWKTTFNGSPGDNQVMNADVYGPISDIHLEENPLEGAPGCRIIARNADGSILNRIQGSGFAPAVKPYGLQISIAYVSGGTQDRYIDKTAPTPPPDNTPYRYDTSPIGNDNTIPSGKPAAGLNKGKDKQVAPSMPSNNTPNGAPFFPGHGGLAPSYLPNPEHQPSNLGGMLPAMQPLPQRQSLPFAEPEDIAVPRITPMLSSGEASTTALNPSTFAYPAYVPETAKPVPISDALSPVPKAKSAPIAKTPTETALDQQKKDFEEQIGRITAIATAIAALTPAIQGIPDAIAKSPTVQAANKETTQGAVCEIAQPGGCLGKAIDDSANKVNQNNNQNTANLLDKINAGANAAQLALLELINTKLGDLIPGGISGKLQRLSQWLHLDRVLNILIWWQTLHNAYMLSANLGQTLTSAISNVLAAIGIKDAEGSPLNIGEILGSQFDSLAKSVIGESEWGGIKAEYKKWNRIYQAAANLMNSIQSIGYSILSALEVVGSWVAVIGNALRKWGEVGESAYRWMNPTPDFQNKFFTALETTENVVSQVDIVASEVLSVQDTVTQIGTQKTEFLKALGQEPDGKQGTTPPEATQVKAGFDLSKLVSATGLELNDTDFEADEDN